MWLNISCDIMKKEINASRLFSEELFPSCRIVFVSFFCLNRWRFAFFGNVLRMRSVSAELEQMQKKFMTLST